SGTAGTCLRPIDELCLAPGDVLGGGVAEEGVWTTVRRVELGAADPGLSLGCGSAAAVRKLRYVAHAASNVAVDATVGSVVAVRRACAGANEGCGSDGAAAFGVAAGEELVILVGGAAGDE